MTDIREDRRPTSAVVTLPDPDNTHASSHAEVGGTLLFRSENPRYPKFRVKFPKGNPANKAVGHVFEGSIDKPLVLYAQNEGDFEYEVEYVDQNGKMVPVIVIGASRIQRCQSCPAIVPPPPNNSTRKK